MIQMRKEERREGGVEEFHSLQISARLFSVDHNVAICCFEMRGFELIIRHSLDVLSIAFVVVAGLDISTRPLAHASV